MNERTPIGEAELRLALRGLRRDIEPARDLWPDIAARIGALPRQGASRRRPPWLLSLATAASLAAALGLAWQLRAPPASAPAMSAALIPASPMPPQPNTATVCPGSTFAVRTTAP